MTGLDVRQFLAADARAARGPTAREPVVPFLALVACLATIVALLGFLQ